MNDDERWWDRLYDRWWRWWETRGEKLWQRWWAHTAEVAEKEASWRDELTTFMIYAVVLVVGTIGAMALIFIFWF